MRTLKPSVSRYEGERREEGREGGRATLSDRYGSETAAMNHDASNHDAFRLRSILLITRGWRITAAGATGNAMRFRVEEREKNK